MISIICILLFVTVSIVAYFKGFYAGVSVLLTIVIIMFKFKYPITIEIVYSVLGCIGFHIAKILVNKYKLSTEYITKIETELSKNQQIVIQQKNNLENILIEKEIEIQQNVKRINTIEKLSSLGTIIGGVAHDFNNLLTSGLGYSELLIEDEIIATNPRLLKYTKSITNSMQRSAELVKQMLTFARKSDNNKKCINVHKVLKNTLPLSNTITKQIKIIENYKATNVTILGNETQLQNAFLNLIINAKDAIEIPDHGMISIATTNETLTSNCNLNVLNSKTIKDGEYIKVEISDNGTGISPEVMNKIFEPFVTTKNGGNTTGGTGLGLSTVYGTTNTHNGYITVNTKTTEGSYTSFSLYFPIDKNYMDEIEDINVSCNHTNKPNILIVDDDFDILEIFKAMLNNHYNVTTLQYPEKAVNLYKSENYDLVIVDMIMPKMNGKELCHNIKKINDKQKVILSTGYVGNNVVDISEFDKVIYKPLRKQQLLNEINTILNA